MERKIKFRGQRTDTKEWVYGYFVEGWNDESQDEFKHFEEYYIIECTGDRYSVIPESIGQFIGLKDKNGKEIYEGDIMLYSIIHSSTDKKRIGEKQYAYIKWLDKEAKFVQAFNNSDDYEMLDETMKLTEIIGNIFENPELLK